MAFFDRFRQQKKKTYVAERVDYSYWAVWVLVLSIAWFLVAKGFSNSTNALPVLLAFPTLIGILVFFILLPIRVLMFVVTEIFIQIYLRNVPRNIPARTTIVTGKRDYFQPSTWVSPNYGEDLLILTKYLRLKGETFSIYSDVTPKIFDEIMANKEIKEVYLCGHGRRHGFSIDSNIVIDYCRYDNPRFEKDFVYQLHCNNGGGKSLVDYVVPVGNQSTCLPEHGYMSSFTIYSMFADKIIELKKLGGLQAVITRYSYKIAVLTIPAAAFIIWSLILSKIMF